MGSTWSPQFSGGRCRDIMSSGDPGGGLGHAHPADEPHLPGDPAGRGEGDGLLTRKCTWVTSKGFVVLGCNCQEFQFHMKRGGTGRCSWEQVRRGMLCPGSLAKDLSGDRGLISMA